jgi:hypothetical protein
MVWREDVLLPSVTEALFCEKILWGCWDDPVQPASAFWLHPHWSHSWRSQTPVLRGQRTLPKHGCFQSKAADKASLYDDRTVKRDWHMRSLPGELLESSAVEISSAPLIRLRPSIGSKVTSWGNLDTNWARGLSDQTPLRLSAAECWWTQRPKWNYILVSRHHFAGWFRFS